MRGYENVPVDWAPATHWLDDDTGLWHTTLQFIVPGQPIQQGNIIGNRYGSLYDKTKGLKTWRAKVAWQAQAAMNGRYRNTLKPWIVTTDEGVSRIPAAGTVLPKFTGAVMLDVTFVRRRTTTLPKSATPPHVTYPDLSKLVRAVEDSMTGIVWDDDKQVVETHSRKRYADVDETCGAHILVTSNVNVK
jgi:Holliday junction resolvase RusA-like endonuclease